MSKLIFIAMAGLLLTAQLAAAEDYDACVEKTEKVFNECMAKTANLINDVEIQDAKDACENTLQSTRRVCDDGEANRASGVVDPDAAKKEGQ
jgi:hypothetical protein